MAPGAKHSFSLFGPRRARIVRRSTLPTVPGFVTRISSFAPGRSRLLRTSDVRSSLDAFFVTLRVFVPKGQPLPLHLTRTVESARAPRTERALSNVYVLRGFAL